MVRWEASYQVSNLGRVRSIERRTPYKDTYRTHKSRVLKQFRGTAYGYMQVKLSRQGHTESAYVHRLVLESFAGPCPKGMEGLHGPSGNLDNRWPENLSWGTHQQNCLDKRRDGTSAQGLNYGNARLTEAIVLEIRVRQQNGESMASLAQEFDVHANTVHDVIARRTWAHVT